MNSGAQGSTSDAIWRALGQPSGGAGADRDRQLVDLVAANALLGTAINNIPQALVMFDADQRLLVCNERYREMYGLSPDIVRPGCTLRDVLSHRRELGNFFESIDAYIETLRAHLRSGHTRSFITRLSDGRVIALTNQPLPNGSWVATHEDITERERAEARIAHMARHDALTGLGNRVLFGERLQQAIAELRQDDRGFAILVFDLDLFKSVNDSLGHPIGDALLQQVAQRLRQTTGETETPCRLGGDEFALVRRADIDQGEAAVVFATRLLDTICQPYEVQGHKIVIGISVGIALAPRDGMDADQLLKNADLAMYRAKSEGRNGYRFFEADMDREARARRTLELDLRNARFDEEFELHYQRIVDATTERTVTVEALVRWRHPRQGLLSPDSRACSDAVRWPAEVNLAVNLSPAQFGNGALIDIVVRALLTSGLPPERLEIEVTETVLLRRDPKIVSVLHQLRNLGIRIVLDDFGTGYSSLSNLRMFPFGKIKIDRAFIEEFTTRPDCAAIVCAMIGLGRNLDMRVTAEGVETREQLDLLRAAGCGEVQGYLFSRPGRATEIEAELQQTGARARVA
jgi:diguanylate cyclase (GGDEF)-like protein/PAS domain S-box-containing protein